MKDIGQAIIETKFKLKNAIYTATEQEPQLQLLLEFLIALEKYIPDWYKICKMRLHPDSTSENQDNIKKYNFLSQRIAYLKKMWGYSSRQFAYACNKSHTYIISLENQEADFPPKDIEEISKYLGVSVPYLLGLNEEPTVFPSIVETYFYEFPDNKFSEIKDLATEVLEIKKLSSPIVYVPKPVKRLKVDLCELIDDDARMGTLILRLFQKDKSKRSIYVKILEELLEL